MCQQLGVIKKLENFTFTLRGSNSVIVYGRGNGGDVVRVCVGGGWTGLSFKSSLLPKNWLYLFLN